MTILSSCPIKPKLGTGHGCKTRLKEAKVRGHVSSGMRQEEYGQEQLWNVVCRAVHQVGVPEGDIPFGSPTISSVSHMSYVAARWMITTQYPVWVCDDQSVETVSWTQLPGDNAGFLSTCFRRVMDGAACSR